MKKNIQQSVVFIGKSMLWSLLLYGVMMLATNWDEISNKVSGKNKITIVNNILPELQAPCINNPA